MTPAEKECNRELSNQRVAVDHHLRGVKRSRIVHDTFCNRKKDYVDSFMETACGLHNFRVSQCQIIAESTSTCLVMSDEAQLDLLTRFAQHPSWNQPKGWKRRLNNVQLLSGSFLPPNAMALMAALFWATYILLSAQVSLAAAGTSRFRDA